MRIGLDHPPDLATGAAFLGTGGGDPFAGRMLAAQAIRAHREVELIALSDVPDGAFVVPVGNMGAPTVLVERIPSGEEPVRALQFKGKIVDVRRESKQGFAIGRVSIDGLDGWRDRMTITFQNENLTARAGDEVRAIVPDIVCILDSALAEPVATERLRYGQRVSVMGGVGVPPIMRAPEALEVFGPAAFGFEQPFVPVEELPN